MRLKISTLVIREIRESPERILKETIGTLVRESVPWDPSGWASEDYNPYGSVSNDIEAAGVTGLLFSLQEQTWELTLASCPFGKRTRGYGEKPSRSKQAKVRAPIQNPDQAPLRDQSPSPNPRRCTLSF